MIEFAQKNRQRLIVIVIPLLFAGTIVLLQSCQQKASEYASSPLPAISTGASAEVANELKWLLGVNQYIREKPRAQLSVDTLDRLNRFTENNVAEPVLNKAIFSAIAQRLVADQYLMGGQTDEGRERMVTSLETLLEVPIDSPSYYYELVNQHNLLATALEQSFLLQRAIGHSRDALELSVKHGFLLSEAQERHQLSLLYGYIQREDLQRIELKKALTLAQEHSAFFTAEDPYILPAIRMSLVRNATMAARKAIFIGDTTTARKLDREARDMVPLAEALIKIADPTGEQKMIDGLLRAQIHLGVDLDPNPETLPITKKAIQQLLASYEGKYSATVVAMDEAIMNATYHRRCGSAYYQDALAALAEHDPATGHPAYLRVRNLIARRVASYECLCAEIQQDRTLMQSARNRANQMTRDYESYLTRQEGGIISESLAGNWEGFYTDAIDIASRADRFLNPKSDTFSFTALSLSDRAKSLSLGSSLLQIQTTSNSSPAYESRRAKLQVLITLSNEAINQPGSGNVLERQQALALYLDELKKSDSDIDQRILRDFRQFPEISLAEVRSALPDGRSAAIDLFHGKGYLLVSVITKTEEKQFHLPVTQALLQALEATKKSPASGDLLASKAFTIYQTALEPVIDWVSQRGVNNLLIVRDKSFSRLAFGYLPMVQPMQDSWSQAPLLIDSFVISYFYSLSSLASTRKISQSRRTPLERWASFTATKSVTTGNGISTNALPRLETIVEKTTKELHEGDHLFGDCTPDTLLTHISDYRYLTIAAHGLPKETPSGAYFLQFVPSAQRVDGSVELTDIYPQILSADLTLLLNCGSAKGTSFDAEGRKSFARAFLYAGSSAVIAGNDFLLDPHVAKITERFHHYWISEGMSSSAALRQAKLDFRKSNSHLSPRDWGSLIHYGLPDIYYQP